jgi:cell division protein FtsL
MGIIVLVLLVVIVFLISMIGNMDMRYYGVSSELKEEIEKKKQEVIILKREIALLQNQDRLEDGV